VLVAVLAVAGVAAGVRALARSDSPDTRADVVTARVSSARVPSVPPPAAPDGPDGPTGATSATSPPTLGSSASTTPAPPLPAAVVRARAAVADMVSDHPAGSISLAVTDLTSGARYVAGARGGMRLASAAKLEILETLLLQAGGRLSDSASDCAVPMIEQSDNDAADACFAALGGTAAYRAAGGRLGLSGSTTYGQGYYWGLDTSSAADQVRLLRNLAVTPSPLSAAARRQGLALLRSVESGQRWGVPVVADAGSPVAVKDGWLGVDADGGRWAVNSDAIVRYHGHLLAMSVLTQHDSDEEDGIELVQQLAGLAATAVLGS
jgi:beta-lactamase class A